MKKFAKRIGRRKVTRRKRVGGLGTTNKLLTKIASNDQTVSKLNIGKNKKITVKMSTIPYNIVFDGSVDTNFAANAYFDPSGTYTNFTSTGAGGTATVCPEFQKYSTLYQWYRVTKIKLNFKYQNTLNTPTKDPVAFMRYYYDPHVTPSISNIMQSNNVIQKAFNKNSPMFDYSFYPKAAFLTNNTAVIASEGYTYKKMGWTDVTNPIEIFGFMICTQDFDNTGMFLNATVEYTVQFKQQK